MSVSFYTRIKRIYPLPLFWSVLVHAQVKGSPNLKMFIYTEESNNLNSGEHMVESFNLGAIMLWRVLRFLQ